MARASLEERLARVEAHEAIRQVIARYAIGADRKNDPDILGPLFSDLAVWEAEGIARFEGRRAIADGLAGLARDFVTWSIHYMVSPLIRVAEDAGAAHCRWYLWELCTLRQADGEPADSWYGGWYDSRLSRIEDRWLFDWVKLSPRIASARHAPWAGKDHSPPDLPPNWGPVESARRT